MTSAPVLRAGRDEDAAGFITLIRDCWAEYPGCVFDLDGEVPELRALASYFAARQGALWTAEQGGRVVGMVAAAPGEGAAWEVKRMYVARDQRGSGLARRLLAAAEGHAVAAGASEMTLWSDTRFDRAHRFYEKHSYVRTGPILALGDKSNSIDFAYAKPLVGIAVRRLNAAGAASALGRLSAVLRDCVAEDAAVACLPPFAGEAGALPWKAVASDVAQGRRVLLAAWREGVLVGTVQLALAPAPNQAHRAELQALLVSPDARRHGVATALLAAAEAAAAAAGRFVLSLNVAESGAGEAMFRASGWQVGGRIPGDLRGVDVRLLASVVFLKSLDRL